MSAEHAYPDEIEQLDDTSWRMWAIPDERGPADYAHPGHRRYAQAHSKDPAVPVRVFEQEDGPYWGWLDAKDEKPYPCMVYGHPSLFRMCFPYGPDKEEARGKGRIVRLNIELLDPPA